MAGRTHNMPGDKPPTQLRKDIAAIALILILAGALRLYFFNGMGGHDESVYLNNVKRILGGKAGQIRDFRGARLWFHLPIVSLFKIFGPNYYLAFLPTFVYSLSEILLVFMTGAYVFNDRKAGIFAAVLLSLFPLDAFTATIIRGDAEVGFYSMLGIFLYCLSARFRSWKAVALLVLCGVAVGLAYSVKELSVILVVAYFGAFIAHSLLEGKIKRGYALILLGFVMILAAECVYFRIQFGDWFQRIKAQEVHERNALEEIKLGGKFQHPMFLACQLFSLKNKLCDWIMDIHFTQRYTSFGHFYWFVFLSIAYLLAKKDAKSLLLIAWILTLLAYLQFGTMSIKQYIPIHKEPRLLTLLSGPAMMLFGRAISLFLSDRPKSKARLALVSLLILGLAFQSVAILQEYHEVYIQRNQFNYGVYDFLKDKIGGEMIWGKAYITQFLELNVGYKKIDKGYDLFDSVLRFNCTDNNSGSYIILDGDAAIFDEPRNPLPGRDPEWEAFTGEKRGCIAQELTKPTGWMLLKEMHGGNRWVRIYYIP